jgi:hypothetical protein
MKNDMEKTIEERQATIDKNYRRLFVLLAVCLVLCVAFAVQALN